MDKLKRIIGLTGLAGSGKSLAAELLEHRFDFVRVSFADPLRDMLSSLGIDVRDKSSTPSVLQGRTVRYALQTLGTEWGRNLIGQDVWAAAALHRARQMSGLVLPVVFDDVRFDNEAAAIRAEGGQIWRIVRPGLTRMDHASENGVDDRLVDHTLVNDGSVGQLTERMLELYTTP